MASIMYLGFCLSNALIYTFTKYFAEVNHNVSTTAAMNYTNIVSLILFIPYVIKNFKKLIKAFKKNSRLMLTPPASILKIIAIQHIGPKNAMTIAFLNPFAVTILSYMFLKEYNVNNLKKSSWMFLSLIGAIVFVGIQDIKFSAFWYFVMIMHVVFKSCIHIFLKQLSKDKFSALFYSVLYNCIFTSCISYLNPTFRANFDITYVLNIKIILVGILSVLCQFALIYAYKISSKISSLQNLDFSRIIFTCILSYFMLNSPILERQIIGLLIIFASLVLSNIKAITSKFSKNI